MKRGRIRVFGGLVMLAGLLIPPLGATPPYGKLSGVVADPAGIPQMGATVWITPEDTRSSASLQLLTNERGLFSSDRLLPGLYTVRVTLAGFLPALERHIRVDVNLTTLLRIQLDSVLSSLDRLRRKPNQQTDADEWAWVLRTSAATRSVLRWADGEVVIENETPGAEQARKRNSHSRLELTAGARRPGSVSNIADAPSSAFAYDQGLGHAGRLLLAGQVSYERAAAAGFATLWMPSGEAGRGSENVVVLRHSNLGPGGPTFHGLRASHGNQLVLGDRFTLHYGAEYILVHLGSSTASLRPRAELTAQFSPRWRASLALATRPWLPGEAPANTLQSALEQLDTFPAVMLRNARPVLEGGWHEELAVERLLGANASLLAAVFRDDSRRTAIFGRRAVASSDFFQDFFSNAFTYDGGEMNSSGTRLAYRQKLLHDTETTVIYAWAGALTPEDIAARVNLRDAMRVRHYHSLAARVSTRVPRLGTRVVTSYKWVNGRVASRQDPFGEALFQVDPELNVSVRQPLPAFLFCNRFEALADFRNVLRQGYVPVSTKEGQLVLIPAFRSIRGGLSFQF